MLVPLHQKPGGALQIMPGCAGSRPSADVRGVGGRHEQPTKLRLIHVRSFVRSLYGRHTLVRT